MSGRFGRVYSRRHRPLIAAVVPQSYLGACRLAGALDEAALLHSGTWGRGAAGRERGGPKLMARAAREAGLTKEEKRVVKALLDKKPLKVATG